jgi:hypothetical protein
MVQRTMSGPVKQTTQPKRGNPFELLKKGKLSSVVPPVFPAINIQRGVLLSRLIIAAPSFVWPESIAGNCARLQGFVDEVGLLFFESAACMDYTEQDLPQALARSGLRFHVHLPLDLPWEAGASAVWSIVANLRAKAAFLQPWCHVLHPPVPSGGSAGARPDPEPDQELNDEFSIRPDGEFVADAICPRIKKGLGTKFPVAHGGSEHQSDPGKGQGALNWAWARERLDELARCWLGHCSPARGARGARGGRGAGGGQEPKESAVPCLLLENIQGNDLRQLWPVIEARDLGICLDLGHLLAYGQDTDRIPGIWSRVRMVHLNAPAPNGRHRSLACLDRSGRARLERILRHVEPRCVFMIEVFSPEDFLQSLHFFESMTKDMMA